MGLSAGLQHERPCGDCGTPFTAGPYAKWGPCCRWKYRGKPATYVWTPERDQVLRDHYSSRKGAMRALSKTIGWPHWVLKKRAAVLGLTRSVDRRDWTPEEEAYLFDRLGRRTTAWIARRLKRSVMSGALKAKRQQLSRRFREGYTLRELELCFGESHKAIARWAREGKLVAARRPGSNYARAGWAVTDEDLLMFIRAYPLTFRLDRVDQVWFLDLITSGGLIRKALADERALEQEAV